jgi:hypothetical protein
MVTHNDLGMREAGMSNHDLLQIDGDTLTVRKIHNPDYRMQYALDGDTLTTGPQGRWILDRPTPDSLALLDAESGNRYHTSPLAPRPLPDGLLPYLRAHEFLLPHTYRPRKMSFLTKPGGWNCVIIHPVDPIDTTARPPDYTSGSWTIEQDHEQTLLLYTIDEDDYVLRIDSVGEGISGRLSASHLTSGPPWQVTLAPVPSVDSSNLLPYMQHPLTSSKAELAPGLLDTRWWSHSYSGKELETGLVVMDFEAENLQMMLADGRYSVAVDGRELQGGSYRFDAHGRYLVLGENCTPFDHLPILRADNDTLELALPAKVVDTRPLERQTVQGQVLPEVTRYYSTYLRLVFPLGGAAGAM